MKVDILIYESTILSCVTELIMRGEKPTLKRTKALIREMVTANGEVFTTEPMFTDGTGYVVDWDAANELANQIAPNYYDKIF